MYLLFSWGDGQTSGLGVDSSSSALKTLYVFIFKQEGCLDGKSEGMDLLW